MSAAGSAAAPIQVLTRAISPNLSSAELKEKINLLTKITRILQSLKTFIARHKTKVLCIGVPLAVIGYYLWKMYVKVIRPIRQMMSLTSSEGEGSLVSADGGLPGSEQQNMEMMKMLLGGDDKMMEQLMPQGNGSVQSPPRQSGDIPAPTRSEKFKSKQIVSDETVTRNLNLMKNQLFACWPAIADLSAELREVNTKEKKMREKKETNNNLQTLEELKQHRNRLFHELQAKCFAKLVGSVVSVELLLLLHRVCVNILFRHLEGGKAQKEESTKSPPESKGTTGVMGSIESFFQKNIMKKSGDDLSTIASSHGSLIEEEDLTDAVVAKFLSVTIYIQRQQGLEILSRQIEDPIIQGYNEFLTSEVMNSTTVSSPQKEVTGEDIAQLFRLFDGKLNSSVFPDEKSLYLGQKCQEQRLGFMSNVTTSSSKEQSYYTLLLTPAVGCLDSIQKQEVSEAESRTLDHLLNELTDILECPQFLSIARTFTSTAISDLLVQSLAEYIEKNGKVKNSENQKLKCVPIGKLIPFLCKQNETIFAQDAAENVFVNHFAQSGEVEDFCKAVADIAGG